MSEFKTSWPAHKSFTSAARHVRDLPCSQDVIDGYLAELREARAAFDDEAFLPWVGAFRERIEKARDKAKGGSIK